MLPTTLAVRIAIRGVAAITCGRACAFAVAEGAGRVVGVTGTDLPSTVVDAGGRAVGKNRSDSALQPKSTSADRTTARIMLR